MTDLWLAILHHVLVFGLATNLGFEVALVRPGMSSADAARLARIDAGYGASAGLVLLVGALRVFYGANGADYYLFNIWFWLKIASFAAMGMLSVPPTLRFLTWRNLLRSDPGFVPAPDDIVRVRNFLRGEILCLVLVVTFAATMARYVSY